MLYIFVASYVHELLMSANPHIKLKLEKKMTSVFSPNSFLHQQSLPNFLSYHKQTFTYHDLLLSLKDLGNPHLSGIQTLELLVFLICLFTYSLYFLLGIFGSWIHNPVLKYHLWNIFGSLFYSELTVLTFATFLFYALYFKMINSLF